MITVYCRDRREFTPLAVEGHTETTGPQHHSRVSYLPAVLLILATLKVEEGGIHSFQKVADLRLNRLPC